jgi:hypothetical protein
MPIRFVLTMPHNCFWGFERSVLLGSNVHIRLSSHEYGDSLENLKLKKGGSATAARKEHTSSSGSATDRSSAPEHVDIQMCRECQQQIIVII